MLWNQSNYLIAFSNHAEHETISSEPITNRIKSEKKIPSGRWQFISVNALTKSMNL